MSTPSASRSPSTPDVADEIAAQIARELRPWRVVLFGSRARGTAHADSDYDFYVEVGDLGEVGDPAAVNALLKAAHNRLIGLRLAPGRSVDFKVSPPGTIERRRDDPGTIEWDVAREGRVLYADPAAPRNITPPGRIGEPSREPPESVHEWLASANRNLRLRERISSSEDFSPDICWLSHEVAEKYMKALLVARRVRPDRTHDLTSLLAALRAAGCTLTGLDEDAKLLTKYAVIPRYPAGLDLGADEASAATAAANRIVGAVRAELPPSVH